MANQGPSYGLSREIQLKNQARFSLEEAKATLEWIQSCTKVPLELEISAIRDQHDVGNVLKDGVQLCMLANQLNGIGPIRYNRKPKLPFHKMENISNFLEAIKKYGVPEISCFQTVDLYDQTQIWKVMECLRSLAATCQKNGASLPLPNWAVKMSKENPRKFAPDVLYKGQTVLSLQYGTNKGASQAGMTAYGMPRQIIPEQQRRESAEDVHENGINGVNGYEH